MYMRAITLLSSYWYVCIVKFFDSSVPSLIKIWRAPKTALGVSQLKLKLGLMKICLELMNILKPEMCLSCDRSKICTPSFLSCMLFRKVLIRWCPLRTHTERPFCPSVSQWEKSKCSLQLQPLRAVVLRGDLEKLRQICIIK